MAEPAELSERAASADARRAFNRVAGTLLLLAWILLAVGVWLPGVQFFGPVSAWVYFAFAIGLVFESFGSREDLRIAIVFVPPVFFATLCMICTLALPSRWIRKYFLPKLKRFAWTLLLIWTPLIGMAAHDGGIPNDVYYGLYVVCFAFTLAFVALRLWQLPTKVKVKSLAQAEKGVAPEPEVTHVFVYGTLKCGCENHDRYCSGFISAIPQQIHGLMYLLQRRGYPIAMVPDSQLVAKATGDFTADRILELETRWKGPPLEVTIKDADWPVLRGELLTFNDARSRLAMLDQLETFKPDGSGEYIRCLIWTDPPDRQLAWIYVAPPGWVPDETCRLIDRFPAN